MTDSLKFGPDWLRSMACTGDGYNLTGGGGLGLTTPKYQLAEHRYGREEMLALFDRTLKPPEPLTSFSGLYVQKPQLPLALIQMTEDEQRLWNTGVTANVGRGRGGSVDRGGRAGRPGRTGPHFRGVGFDEVGESPRIETQPFPARTRAFDRPPNERGWSERNGVETVEWNGSTSPRKELSRGVSGGSLMESNWRRSRAGGEDDDGWRTNARGEKWVKSSWRDIEKDRGERVDGDDDKRGERWDHKGSNRAFDSHPPLLRRNRSNHHDNHDNLPECYDFRAVENPGESGGSFDATGAFHGQFSDDDDDYPHDRSRQHRGVRIRRVSEGNSPHPKSSPGVAKSASSAMIRPPKSDRSVNGDRPKSLHGSDSRDLERESRRSLSPIKSSSTSNSPSTKKIPSATSNSPGGNTGAESGVTMDLKKKDKGTKQVGQDKSKDPALAAATTNAPVIKPKSKMEVAKNREEFKKVDRNKVTSNQLEDMNKVDLGNSKNKVESMTLRQQSKNQQQRQLQEQQQMATSIATSVIEQMDDKQKLEPDHLDRIEEEVAKLIEGVSLRDEKPPGVFTATSVVNKTVIDSSGVSQSTSIMHEKWYYRDPQGEVQGPFLASEMSEWHKQGYFAPNLLVRRTCDERYTTLGELISLCGTLPFTPGTMLPPLKIAVDPLTPILTPVVPPTGLPPVNTSLPKGTGVDDPLLLYQFQQYRFLQNQQMISKLRSNAIAKLSQSERWPTLSPVEQNQLVTQYLTSIYPDINEFMQPPIVPNTFMPTMSQTAPPTNAVLQLFPQFQAQIPKTEPAHIPASNSSTHQQLPSSQNSSVDAIQQFMQQLSNIRNLPPMPPQATMMPGPQPVPQPMQKENAIKSWLRQMGVTGNGLQQPQQPPPPPSQSQPPMDSVWHQPSSHLPNSFNAQSWMSQVGAIQPTIPPGQMPGSMWDIHPKEMKTEQQILEEQNLKIKEEKKKEELRKKEELEKRKQEEEIARLKAAEEKREEAERKKREEEKKRREEEKQKVEEEQKKIEEKRRKEEEKKREEKRKHDEEVNRKKQEEEKKRRDELKRQEEKLKKEEEKRRKIEEEQKRQEEERLRKEEEARKKSEAEEQARKAEQRRREAEALRKLQERSKAPWAQAPPAPPPTAQASLAEIQRLEREKKAEEQRLQQLLQQQQLAQQKAAEAAQEALTDSAKRLQFKWAEKVASSSNVNQVKSLEQIQQEEQERVTKTRQQEREKLEKEKAAQKESAVNLQNINIWGGASHSLNWSSAANSGGFWDEPVQKAAKPIVVTAKPAAPRPQLQHTVVKPPAPQQQPSQQQQLQSQQQQQQQQQNNKVAKNKNKKDEELVKKLFEQNTAKTDDFTQWCNKALTGLKVSVDIPTFITFLRDVESPFEVREYVRMYLGDTKQAGEFGKQFLEKRSRWKSSQRPQTQADDLCKPAPAINPNVSTEFQEVKSKSKKPKKGKMFKVDSKMLGFSVMSAPDRINVGDRDYAEGV